MIRENKHSEVTIQSKILTESLLLTNIVLITCSLIQTNKRTNSLNEISKFLSFKRSYGAILLLIKFPYSNYPLYALDTYQ